MADPAGLVPGQTGQDGQRPEYFRADKAWWYITLLMCVPGSLITLGRSFCVDRGALPG
jgi:hypothetical protein